MKTFAIWKLLRICPRGAGEKRSTDSHASVLAVIAFAVSTAVFLIVLGGFHAFLFRASAEHNFYGAFWGEHTTSDIAPTYVLLGLFASLLILVPLSTLAGSAARLVASRRDAELANMRLIGATSSQVTAVSALDATAQALGGALLGIVGYFAAMPLVMQLNFQGRTFSFAELWVGPLALAIAILGVTVLALLSSLIALRGVVVSPLGVSARVTPAALSKWRLWIFLALLALALLSSKLMNLGGSNLLVAIMIIVLPIVGTFALINLIGPLVVRHSALRRLRHARSASQLIAMRRILDNPKRAWRNVSGVALAVFIAGMTSVASLFGSMQGAYAEPAEMTLMKDIGTGGLVTLFFAALLAAVSSGVMQAGDIYDQQDEYRMLKLAGADASVLTKARRMEVMTPLRSVVVVSACCSLVVLLPAMGQALAQPVTLFSFVAGIALCFGLVYVGTLASNRVAASLDVNLTRPDD
ncbi:MAG: ABC transporter permease [Bifidobacteriaceae bacterium]|jgi:hypothetical protein|nr:ABC transporter permease [Bifidobacteriaceae bacterium]